MHGAICYNITNYIANGPALLQTAGTLRHSEVSAMSDPIVPTPDSADNLKRCSKCGELKPRTEFYRHKSKSDGLHSACKQCDFVYRLLHGKVQYVVALPPETKICPQCDVLRPFSDFAKDKTQKDGLQTRCRECQSVIHRQYVVQNADVLRQKAHEYNVSEHGRAKRKAYNAEYRRNNNQYFVEYMAIWRAQNRDRVLLYAREYGRTEKGRDVRRSHHTKRRLRIRDAFTPVTAAEIAQIRKAQTDKYGRLICWRCCKPITRSPHLDHFIPLDKGGRHSPGNLHFMHAKCNLNKSNKHPHELGMLI
jgi:5-methylcytosine-specific restriction endonuclease McrA